MRSALNFSPANPTDTASLSCSMSGSAEVTSRPALSPEVGAVLPAEDALDARIAELDREMVAAMRAGDRDAAEDARERMYAAIASRSPEHQQRLNERAWQRMVDNDPCYFSSAGEMARAKLERGID